MKKVVVNENGIAEELFDSENYASPFHQILGLDNREQRAHSSAIEFQQEALQAQAKTILHMAFAGSKLSFGTTAKTLIVNSLVTNCAAGTGKAIKIGGMARNAAANDIGKSNEALAFVNKFISEVGDIDPDIFWLTLGDNFSKTFALEISPFIGIGVSAYKVFDSARSICASQVSKARLDSLLPAVRAGQIAAAIDAIKELLDRQQRMSAISLGANAVALSGKIAGSFLDFGAASTTAIGCVAAFANLGIECRKVKFDRDQMKAGNAALENPTQLSIEVFNTSPILGCYLLTTRAVETATLVNFKPTEMAKIENWVEPIQKLHSALKSVRGIAKNVRTTSRLQLTDLKANSLSNDHATFGQKVKSSAADYVTSKLYS